MGPIPSLPGGAPSNGSSERIFRKRPSLAPPVLPGPATRQLLAPLLSQDLDSTVSTAQAHTRSKNLFSPAKSQGEAQESQEPRVMNLSWSEVDGTSWHAKADGALGASVQYTSEHFIHASQGSSIPSFRSSNTRALLNEQTARLTMENDPLVGCYLKPEGGRAHAYRRRTVGFRS